MAALKQFVRPEQILYASSADEAIRLLDSRPVALVFLDIEMPEESGFLSPLIWMTIGRMCPMCF